MGAGVSTEAHHKALQDLADANNAREADQARYQKWRLDLQQTMEEAKQRAEEFAAELQKPIKNRQEKIDYVNGLMLGIRQTESLLLVGTKGTGKSTFMWLLGRGAEPVQSFRDGTVEITKLDGYVDSIGLRGWSPDELVKLLVLMVYDGIPKDLIIFGNDRINLPINSLGLLGVNNPFIVIMSSDFWKNYSKQRIMLVEGSDGVKKVQPVENLDYVYNLSVYDEIKEFGLGQPITHHDNIDALVHDRTQIGVRPFQYLTEELGNLFKVNMENESLIETIFRFIYIYEKKYNKDRLSFMNSATVSEFAD